MADSQTRAFVAAVRRQLQAAADPRRAPAMRAYMRGQFEFLGIGAPLRRQLTRDLVAGVPPGENLLAMARGLWALPAREYQHVAIDLLQRHHARLHLEQLPAVLALARRRSWWDTVDGLAMVVSRVLLSAKGNETGGPRLMDRALRDKDFWVRRIAMLHQLGWKSSTDSDRLYRYAQRLAPEPEFFIRKAIGWALRDYARCDPRGVLAFVSRARPALSPLSAREALKHVKG